MRRSFLWTLYLLPLFLGASWWLLFKHETTAHIMTGLDDEGDEVMDFITWVLWPSGDFLPGSNAPQFYWLPILLMKSFFWGIFIDLVIAIGKYFSQNTRGLASFTAGLSYWASFPMPFVVLALLRYWNPWPWGSAPEAWICGVWTYGFFMSAVIGFFALFFALARYKTKQVWLPLGGIVFTVLFALLTRKWTVIY
jgi:hypothetical protein